jgi:hypothetical protein
MQALAGKRYSSSAHLASEGVVYLRVRGQSSQTQILSNRGSRSTFLAHSGPNVSTGCLGGHFIKDCASIRPETALGWKQKQNDQCHPTHFRSLLFFPNGFSGGNSNPKPSTMAPLT